MTTIVYRDGVLAADSRAYSGARHSGGQKAKIFITDRGTLIGCSTNQPGLAEAFARWRMMSTDSMEFEFDKEPSFSALEILPDGRWLLFEDSLFPSGPISGDFIAVGSGAEYALGALSLGATAVAAVEVAAGFDVWTGCPYHILTLEQAAAHLAALPPAPPADQDEPGEGDAA